METCFVKFKNYLKNFKKKYKKDVKSAKESRKLLTFVKGVVDSGNSMGMLDDLDNEFGNYIKNHFPTELSYQLELSDSYISELDAAINHGGTYINAYDNEKAIGFPYLLGVIDLLTNAVDEEVLKPEEATKVLGSTVYFGATHLKKVSEEYKDIVKELAVAFNQYGDFIYAENINMKEVLRKLFQLFPELLFLQENNKFTTEMWFSIISAAYSEFCSRKEECKESIEVKSVDNVSYSNRVGEYYRNGELVKIPDDLNEFVNLLDEEGILESEKRHILQLIGEELKTLRKSKLEGFYADQEEKVIEAANKILDESSNYQGYYYEIKELLGDIRSLEDMYIDATNEEDRDYIISEKDTLIGRLKEIVIPEEEKEVVNVAFLEAADGVSYYFKDLESIDKSVRRRASTLLGKINNDNKRNFRKVYVNDEVDEIYEVINPDLHIIFTEIPGNVFMVIGVAPSRSGYREITNRLLNKKNRENIALIASEIRDEKTKRGYLLKENAKMEMLEEDMARK